MKIKFGIPNKSIRYNVFLLTDQIQKGNLNMEFYLSKKLIIDFISKVLQGKLFQNLKIFCT